MINFKLLYHLGYLKLWTPPLMFHGVTRVNLFNNNPSIRPFGLHYYVGAKIYLNTPAYNKLVTELIEILHKAINIDGKAPVGDGYKLTAPTYHYDYTDVSQMVIDDEFLEYLSQVGINPIILNAGTPNYLKISSAILLWKNQHIHLPSDELLDFAKAYAAID